MLLTPRVAEHALNIPMGQACHGIRYAIPEERSMRRGALKNELRGKLQFTRRSTASRVIVADDARNGAEIGCRDIGIWGAILRAVEDVEEVGAEAKVELFGDNEEPR